MRRFSLLFAMCFAAGCGAATPSAPGIAQSKQALTAQNGIGLNGIGLNGIGLNGIGLNGLGLNGLGLNGLGLNGLGLNGLGLNGLGLNGLGLNGLGLNGLGLNGLGLNGLGLNTDRINNFLLAHTLSSVDLAPVVLSDGTAVLDASLDGSALTGSHDGRTYSVEDFAGARLVGNMGDKKAVVLRIESVTPATSATDLDLYQVSWFNHADNAWEPICTDADGNAAPASAVANYWDYSIGTETGGSKIYDSHKFTFACQGGAIYKCMEWGYRPWESVNGTSLDAYHQACTRMTRADYCGDGMPHTIDGSWINLYDNLGIQTDDADWVFEAQWSADGATCIAPDGVDHRVREHLSCYPELATSSCAADSPNALLSTETPFGKRSPEPGPDSPAIHNAGHGG